jgi:hypothetical protein
MHGKNGWIWSHKHVRDKYRVGYFSDSRHAQVGMLVAGVYGKFDTGLSDGKYGVKQAQKHSLDRPLSKLRVIEHTLDSQHSIMVSRQR